MLVLKDFQRIIFRYCSLFFFKCFSCATVAVWCSSIDADMYRVPHKFVVIYECTVPNENAYKTVIVVVKEVA
jgi:hypothetical protein